MSSEALPEFDQTGDVEPRTCTLDSIGLGAS